MAQTTDLNLRIDGMHCASCVHSIEQGVSRLDGVDTCRVNLAMNSAVVSYDSEQTDLDRIIEEIQHLGFQASVQEPDVLTSNERHEKEARLRFYTALLLTSPLILLAMIPMFTGEPIFTRVADGILQAVIAGMILFYSGRFILKDAAIQARYIRGNMNTLIALGTLTAYFWSVYALISTIRGVPEALFFDSAGMIVTLILLGRYLESRAKGRAGEAIRALWQLRPAKATAVINNVELEIDTDAIRPGMLIIVKPGERLPADGKIVEGSPVIDESMVTGESLPVEKRPGDEVVGGSLNGNVSFRFEVTAAGAESYLATVVRLVAEAQGTKAPVQRLADTVASVFVPVVLGLAIITGLVWYFYAPDSPLLIRSVVSVLIIACPCALGLATPTAVLAGTGRAAREGIIIRGGDILEEIRNVNAVVFDKTGTLTHGELEVVQVKTFEQLSEQSMLRIVGAIEMHSEHPVGRAIARYMKTNQIEPAVVKDIEAQPGFGLTGMCDGRRLVIGNRALMEKENVSLGSASHVGDREMDRGRTVVYAAREGEIVGLISLADRIRTDSRDIVNYLKPRMRMVTMISGDSRRTAEGIARSLNLEHFEAEIKPEQKKLMVESYRKVGFKVAMVGDGINDAPALAAADIGIAVSGGTDIAAEAADVVLVRPHLMAIKKVFDISHISMRVIKQNLFWAFFYNVIAIPLAAGAFYPAFGWTLSPIIAAAAMSMSSVIVVSNSMRLSRVEL